MTAEEIQSRAAAIAADMGGEDRDIFPAVRDICGLVLKAVAEEREHNARIAEAIATAIRARGAGQ